MCGNGALIGMEATAVRRRRIREALIRARTVCFAVVGGPTSLRAAGWLIATTVALATAATAASALP